SQNANLVNQSTPSSVSLLNFTNSASSTTVSRPVNSNKITTATQTSGATLGSILSAAAKVTPTSESHFSTAPSISSKPVESQSPLIEALMSPIGKLSRNPTIAPQSQSKADANQF